jgi:hypothetical protein
MGVPEQLRRLDEDLATGRVDAESYRRRRDDLLAARLPPPPPRSDTAPDVSALDDSELDAAERELGFAPEFDEPPREPRLGSAPEHRTARGETGPPVEAARIAPPDPPTEVEDEAEIVETAEDAATADPDAAHPRGIPVPPAADAPPLPGTPASSPGLRPPPPPPEDDDAVETDERPLPADPFPPPFRWSSPDDPDDPDGEASPDITQVVRGAPGPAADRTQVVATGRAPEETQVVPGRATPTRFGPPPPPRAPARPPLPTPERTQFVPGAVPARAAGGGVARPEETAPPWASAAARSEGLQGRELFARGPGPRAGAILGTVAVLLLVVLVLVVSFALA